MNVPDYWSLRQSLVTDKELKRTYRGMDRVEQETHPTLSNHHRLAPSPWIAGCEQDEDFGILQTRDVEERLDTGSTNNHR